jgi:oxygen-independent coproporphyrinogen-3 oxidase
VLAEAGLEWYEISNWARPGARCEHNLLYWAQGEYIGIGCAAHSHRSAADGTARRWWNVRDPERYIGLVEAGQSTESASETLEPQQRSWEALVLSLRTSNGVPATVVPPELFEQGLFQCASARSSLEADRAVLTPKGRLLANEVATRLVLPDQVTAAPGNSGTGVGRAGV